MTNPSRIVVPAESGDRKSAPRGAPEPALRVVVLVAVALAMAALIDFGALWWPVRFGNLDWEFATIAATADALPLTTLTLGVLLGIAIWRGRRLSAGVLGGIYGVLGLAALSMLVMHALNAPIALRAVALESRPLVVKAAAKTVALLGLYAALYGSLAWLGLRAALRRRG